MLRRSNAHAISHVFFSALISISIPVWAQHVHGAETQIDAQAPLATLSVQTQRSTFQFPYLSQGSAWLVMPSVHLRLSEQMGVFATAPLGVVSEQKRAASWGMSDVMIGVDWRVSSLMLGLMAMLPTGDPHLGLGAAHLMVVPTLSWSATVGQSAVQLQAGSQIAVSADPHVHQSLVMPMDTLDFRARARFIQTFGLVSLRVGTESIWAPVLNAIAPVGTRLNVSGGLGLKVGRLRLSIDATGTVLGRRSQPLRLDAAVAYDFEV